MRTVEPTLNSPPAASPALTLGPTEPLTDRNSTLLFRTGLLATLALCAYFAVAARVEDPLHRYQGLAILVLSLLPGLLWAKRQDTSYPVFQTFMITGLNGFALPLLGGHDQLNLYPVDSVSAAAWGVILFQLCAFGSYRLVTGLPGISPWWTTPLFTRNVEHYLRVGMGAATLYTAIAGFSEIIPTEIVGILRAISFGIGILCTFLLSRAWGAGELSRNDRVFFVLTLGLQTVFIVSTLFLVSGLSMIVLALLGYVSGGKRLPFLACLLLFACMAILHNGKSAMRLKYWENQTPKPTMTELPAFFGEWIGYGLNPPQTAGAEKFASRKLIERTSLLHMLTLVVDATPARQPFLEGETYEHILPQLIPRVFWPDKPVGHVSTHRLATYYGLQNEESTLKTTIGFGIVVESYANFGFIGLAFLGILVGTGTKLAGIWSRHSPLVSYPGLLMVLLMAWSFQIELPMSAWISSLYQAAIATIGVPFALRLVFH